MLQYKNGIKSGGSLYIEPMERVTLCDVRLECAFLSFLKHLKSGLD